MPQNQHTRNFHSALRWLAAGRAAGQAVSWVMTVLVIRLLSPADYGLAAMVATVTALITIIAEFGFSVAIVQAKEITREQLASIFGAAIIFGLLSALAVAGLAPLAASFYAEPQLTPLLQVAALNFLILSFATVPDGELRRNNRFDRLAWADFVSTLVASLMTYWFALSGKGVWALLLGQLIASAVRVILLQLMVTERIWPSLQIGKAMQLIRFGGQIALSRIIGYATTQSDLLIAGRFLGKESLGFYYVAIDLAMMPLSKVMSIVNQAALPALAQIKRDNHKDKNEILLRSLKLMGYVTLPTLWGMAAISPSLISTVLGNQWIESTLPLQLICLTLPLRVISILMSTAVIAYGHGNIELRNNLTNALIFPVCFFIGAQYGLIGFALSWSLALPATVGINLYRTKDFLNISFHQVLKQMTRPALLSGGMAILVYTSGLIIEIPGHDWVVLNILVIEGVVTFCTLLWFFDKGAVISLASVVSPSIGKKLQISPNK
jgi:O-antigen/teichoic acid export membrane protein